MASFTDTYGGILHFIARKLDVEDPDVQVSANYSVYLGLFSGCFFVRQHYAKSIEEF